MLKEGGEVQKTKRGGEEAEVERRPEEEDARRDTWKRTKSVN